MPIRALLIALCLCCAEPASAAAGIDWPSLADTVIRTVARKHDMPAPLSPFTFAQDGAGFLWAGGQNVLLRWDGYQFRAYTTAAGASDGLRNHHILALHTDRAGTLWVGTEEGGLARYDPAADRFQPVILEDRRGEARRIWSMDDDGAGGLWVGTDRGLTHLDDQARIVPPRLAPSSVGSGAAGSAVFALPGRHVQAVVQGGGGRLWIGGSDGLARISPDGSVTPVPLPSSDEGPADVTHLLQDSAGRIWAGTQHRGAYVIDPASLQVWPVPIPPGLAVPDLGLEIMAIEEVEPGRIWMTAFGFGIFDVNPDTLHVRVIARDPMVPDTLDSNATFGLYRDRGGVTWIGTSEALDQYVPPSGAIRTVFGNPARLGGLPTNVTAVLARPDGSVWLGSQFDGILILGADGKPVRRLPVPRVFSLAADDASGNIYIGLRSGLFVAGPSGEGLRKVEIPQRRPSASVASLLADGGTLWVGGGDDDGVWQVRPTANGPFTVLRHVTAPALPTASIETLAIAPGGLLAVGTSSGAALLNRATGAAETLAIDPPGTNATPSEVVSFLTDRHGRLWIGTDDDGIAVMLGRDAAGQPVFHRITTADGLPDADMNRMLADDVGRVWVGTDNGIAVIDTGDFAVRALREGDGVAVSTYLKMSGDRTPQGELLFGGHGGLTIVQPGTVRRWFYQPPLAVTNIRAGGKVLRTRDAEIVIRPEANSISVEFAALDFSTPGRNLYRYMLEGFDQDYIATDSAHRVAAYTNLPPGRYTLCLQGSNRSGIWSQTATLRIRVLPAWFETIPVRIGEVALLVLFGGGIAQARTVWLRRRQRHLESLVQERTSDLVSTQKKLAELAYVDSLTALPNRRAFNDVMLDLLATAEQEPYEFALMLIDLDGFKRVNDTLGHDAGDELLSIAAGRLRAAVRGDDFVARLGGDEFAILLRQIKSLDAVKLVCDRVVAGMMAPIDIKGNKVRIGASVGVSLSPRHGRTAEDLYKHTDEALYRAKRNGKGMWCWYQNQPLEDA